MILCLNCKNQDLDGALYCTECGSLLVHNRGTTAQVIQNLKIDKRQVQNTFAPSPARGSSIALLLVESNDTLSLEGRTEYTIGRSTADSSVLPDVDLSLYQAYEKGLSRRHLLIRVGQGNVTVTDLNSVNGTHLNGTKIIPHQGYPVAHGDILLLGRLKVQVLIHTT